MLSKMNFSDSKILKPCPFCGGDARFEELSHRISNIECVGWNYTIKCSKCGVKLPQTATLLMFMNNNGLPSITSSSEGIRNTLIDAWNQRKGDD